MADTTVQVTQVFFHKYTWKAANLLSLKTLYNDLWMPQVISQGWQTGRTAIVDFSFPFENKEMSSDMPSSSLSLNLSGLQYVFWIWFIQYKWQQ